MLRLTVKTLVNAPKETVFRILRSVECYPRLFRYMKEVRIIKREEQTVVADVVERVGDIEETVRARFRFYPPDRLEITQLKGPFKKAWAFFALAEVAEGTHLTHTAQVDLGLLGNLWGEFVMRWMYRDRMVQELAAVKRVAEREKQA